MDEIIITKEIVIININTKYLQRNCKLINKDCLYEQTVKFGWKGYLEHADKEFADLCSVLNSDLTVQPERTPWNRIIDNELVNQTS